MGDAKGDLTDLGTGIGDVATTIQVLWIWTKNLFQSSCNKPSDRQRTTLVEGAWDVKGTCIVLGSDIKPVSSSDVDDEVSGVLASFIVDRSLSFAGERRVDEAKIGVVEEESLYLRKSRRIGVTSYDLGARSFEVGIGFGESGVDAGELDVGSTDLGVRSSLGLDLGGFEKLGVGPSL